MSISVWLWNTVVIWYTGCLVWLKTTFCWLKIKSSVVQCGRLLILKGNSHFDVNNHKGHPVGLYIWDTHSWEFVLIWVITNLGIVRPVSICRHSLMTEWSLIRVFRINTEKAIKPEVITWGRTTWRCRPRRRRGRCWGRRGWRGPRRQWSPSGRRTRSRG